MKWGLAGLLAFGLQAAEFNTYIGDLNDYQVARIVADAAGNTYVAGSRSQGGPTTEAFITKLDSAGNIVAFATLSGKGSDAANDIAVDAAGNIYIAGGTTSGHLPLRNALQTTPGPGFIAKFNPDATQILYATYFPAAIRAMAIDSAGGMYVTGTTNSSTFPATAGLPNGPVSFAAASIVSGAFLTKISADGSRILYSALIAGHNKDCGAGSSCFLSGRNTQGVAVAVDAAGNGYMAGQTDTNDLPTTTGAFLTKGTGAFVAKVNAAGTALAYLTLIGATNYVFTPYANPANVAYAMAVDGTGNAYLAGRTFDPSFPATAGSYQSTYSGPIPQAPYPTPQADAFALELNPTGSGLVWATYLGGKQEDAATSISLDASGNVWLTGTTASPDFPNRQGWSKGGDFLAGLNPSGSALIYAGRYPNGSVSQSVAVDAAGTVHAAGALGVVSAVAPGPATSTRIFGITNAAYGPLGGRLAPGEIISIYGPNLAPKGTAVSGVPDSSGLMPTTLGGVQVFMNQRPAPLLYVSDSQINAVVPTYAGAPTVEIHVAGGGAASPDFPAAALRADPQIFQNPDGSAAVVNQDGTINSASNPAAPGSIVAVWVTGISGGGLVEGRLAGDAHDYGCCVVYAYGIPAEVLYGGAAPGIVDAAAQVNFRLPATPMGTTVPVTVLSGGRTSAAAVVYIAQPAE